MQISVFSLHYFLWFGAITSIHNYESVYAREYANASTLEFGYFNLVVPFLTILITPYLCTLADRYQEHRNYFTFSLVVTTMVLAAFGLVPLIIGHSEVEHKSNRYVLIEGTGLLAPAPIDDKFSGAAPKPGGLHWVPWIVYCILSFIGDIAVGINVCLADSFAVLQAEELDTSFGNIIVYGTFGWAASALVLSYINRWRKLPRLVPGLLYGTILLTIDVFIVSFWNKPQDFMLDLLPREAAYALTRSTSTSKFREPSNYMPRNEPAKINLGMEPEEPGSGVLRRRLIRSPLLSSKHELSRSISRSTSSDQKGKKRGVPAYKNYSPTPPSVSVKPKVEYYNSAAKIHDNIDLKTKNLTDEQQGSSKKVVKKIVSPKSTVDDLELSSVVTIPSQFELKTNKVSSTLDLKTSRSPIPLSSEGKKSLANQKSIINADAKNTRKTAKVTFKDDNSIETITDKEALAGKKTSSKQIPNQMKQLQPPIKLPDFKVQLFVIYLIMKRRKALIRYLILFTMSGFLMAMHWNYFFLYLDLMHSKNFAFISALSMVGQSLIGELPFFILSRKIIDLLGRSHALSFSFITIGIRFLIYCYLLPRVSMYYVFLADFWQGPNYGLFYVIMTEIGTEYSYCDNSVIDQLCKTGKLDRNDQKQIDLIRLSVRSVVQSFAYACYEGIGVGFGCLGGGFILVKYGFRMLWSSMAALAIVIGLANILFEYFIGESCRCRQESDERDFVEARESGGLATIKSQKQFLAYSTASSSPSSPIVLKTDGAKKMRLSPANNKNHFDDESSSSSGRKNKNDIDNNAKRKTISKVQ